jgi:hypothetical protein
MLLVAELDLGEGELAALFDEGLVGTVHHDVADLGVVEELLQRAEAEQLVDEHLFERELLAAVEVDLQLGEDLADDRAEFLGELVLGEGGDRRNRRRAGFRAAGIARRPGSRKERGRTRGLRRPSSGGRRRRKGADLRFHLHRAAVQKHSSRADLFVIHLNSKLGE